MILRRIASAAPLCLVALSAIAAGPSISWRLFPNPATPSHEQTPPGKIDFENACAVCHAPQPDRPGTMSLQFKYAGRLPAALEQRVDLTPERVTYYVRHGIAMMPSFRKTELSDSQVAAIATYLSAKHR
jgi:mono/diheme cytochrome c family protein